MGKVNVVLWFTKFALVPSAGFQTRVVLGVGLVHLGGAQPS